LEHTIDTQVERVHIPAWAWLLVAFAALAIYFLTLDNGTILKAGAHTLHEFFHDGRHFLAVPCH
jgi:hypothetical protein